MVNWFREFAGAIADGEPTYLLCESCEAATVPPRSVCPDCGGDTLVDRPLSTSATVLSTTEIHVSTPDFAETTPYTVVLGKFEEGVRLTGQLRGVDGVERGGVVELGVEEVGEGQRILTFRPG